MYHNHNEDERYRCVGFRFRYTCTTLFCFFMYTWSITLVPLTISTFLLACVLVWECVCRFYQINSYLNAIYKMADFIFALI